MNYHTVTYGLQPTSDGLQPTVIAMASSLIVLASNLEAMASNLIAMGSNGNCLQPISTGLQPSCNGLQPVGNGLRPNNKGLHNLSLVCDYCTVYTVAEQFLRCTPPKYKPRNKQWAGQFNFNKHILSPLSKFYLTYGKNSYSISAMPRGANNQIRKTLWLCILTAGHPL